MTSPFSLCEQPDFPGISVEAGFAGGASTADYLHLDDVTRGLLNTATLAPDNVWQDISEWVQRVATIRGLDRVTSPILRYEAGTAGVDLNNSDRRFDPTNLSGPYVSAGITQVTPMRSVRVKATWKGTTYALWRGFADEWQIDYDGAEYSRCRLLATDAVKVLRNIDRAAVSAVGAGENAGARVNRILNSVSWPAADRMVATGNTTLQATTLEGKAWDELLLVSETEIGEVYIDAAGRVVFRNRQSSMESRRSIYAQALFGGEPTVIVAPALNDVTTTANLALNPSSETNIDYWFAGGSVPPTLSQSSAQALFGTKSLLVTWGTGGSLPLADYSETVGFPALVFGKTYTISLYVFVPAGSPDVFLFLQGGYEFFDGLGEGTALKDQWVRLTKTHVTTGSTWSVQIWPNSAPVAGDKVYVDGLQIEEGPNATLYVDGDQLPPPSTVIEWDDITSVSLLGSTSRRLPELPGADVGIQYNDTTIANNIRVTRVGGTEQVANDAASQQLNLTRTHKPSQDLLMQTDLVAADYAQFLLYQSKDPELRFTNLIILPQSDPDNLFPLVLGLDIGDRIRVIVRPPGGGTIVREAFIRGVGHSIEQGDWITVWTLQSATKWSFLTLDHTTLGRLNENALGF